MLLALAVASLMQAAPADTAQDRWLIEGEVSGFPIRMECTVAVVDTVLSGNCGSGDESSVEIRGTVEGEQVNFSHGAEYEGEPITVFYSGTAESETDVRGSVDVQPFGVTGWFTARQLTAEEAAG